jgi:hypothetical protein
MATIASLKASESSDFADGTRPQSRRAHLVVLSKSAQCEPVATMLQFRYRAGRLMGLLPVFDLEYFGRTALLTCEREFLEFTDEQDWCDRENDHFCSAFRTC